jgi:hypothetical protein
MEAIDTRAAGPQPEAPLTNDGRRPPDQRPTTPDEGQRVPAGGESRHR